MFTSDMEDSTSPQEKSRFIESLLTEKKSRSRSTPILDHSIIDSTSKVVFFKTHMLALLMHLISKERQSISSSNCSKALTVSMTIFSRV